MSRIPRKEWYNRVNAAWPEQLPELAPAEALAAARKLYRFVRGRSFDGAYKLTSGRRYTAIRRKVFYVNPTGHTGGRRGGWEALVHDMSHILLPINHGGRHARLELRMIKEVVKRGWLGGVLKPVAHAAASVDTRLIKRQRIEARIANWERKQRRAETALKKLRRSLKYYLTALD